ncbi:MAG: hypothetical protein IKY61_09295, partial [Thermoguttaceae bacterium]|nr:hypothetical protein [Thermoguttaceae bacterium]
MKENVVAAAEKASPSNASEERTQDDFDDEEDWDAGPSLAERLKPVFALCAAPLRVFKKRKKTEEELFEEELAREEKEKKAQEYAELKRMAEEDGEEVDFAGYEEFIEAENKKSVFRFLSPILYGKLALSAGKRVGSLALFPLLLLKRGKEEDEEDWEDGGATENLDAETKGAKSSVVDEESDDELDEGDEFEGRNWMRVVKKTIGVAIVASLVLTIGYVGLLFFSGKHVGKTAGPPSAVAATEGEQSADQTSNDASKGEKAPEDKAEKSGGLLARIRGWFGGDSKDAENGEQKATEQIASSGKIDKSGKVEAAKVAGGLKPQETTAKSAASLASDATKSALAASDALLNEKETNADASGLPEGASLDGETTAVSESTVPETDEATGNLTASSSVSESEDDLIAPSSVAESEGDLIDPSSVSESEGDLIDPSSVAGIAEDLPSPSSVSESEDDLIAPSSVAESEGDLIDPSSVSESEGDLMDPSSVAGTVEDLTAPLAIDSPSTNSETTAAMKPTTDATDLNVPFDGNDEVAINASAPESDSTPSAAPALPVEEPTSPIASDLGTSAASVALEGNGATFDDGESNNWATTGLDASAALESSEAALGTTALGAADEYALPASDDSTLAGADWNDSALNVGLNGAAESANDPASSTLNRWESGAATALSTNLAAETELGGLGAGLETASSDLNVGLETASSDLNSGLGSLGNDINSGLQSAANGLNALNERVEQGALKL